MSHPDIAIVQAEEVGGTLRVNQIRELQHSLSLAPYEARHRVAILLRFEEAHISASNALLKTLEEPPERVVLILTASDAEALLPTIVSRCEIIRLRPLSLHATAEGLQHRWKIPETKARLLAHISGGRPGYALQLNAHEELLVNRQTWLDDHDQLLSQPRRERFDYAQKLANNKESLRQVLNAWLSLWRDIILKASGAHMSITNIDREEQIQDYAHRIGLQHARRIAANIQHTTDLIDHNVNTRLAVEVLLLDLPYI
jgi:DNA polymerase-3 subunit delta'